MMPMIQGDSISSVYVCSVGRSFTPRMAAAQGEETTNHNLSRLPKAHEVNDTCHNLELPDLEESESDQKKLDIYEDDDNYYKKIKGLQDSLDMVKKMVKPGCSPEVLRVALDSMASVVDLLSSGKMKFKEFVDEWSEALPS